MWLQVLTFVSLALGSLYLVLAESRDEIQRIAAERERGRQLESLGRMASGVPQANGEIAVEPVMDVDIVGRSVLYMASLPLEANVLFHTVMATKMPFVGRG